MWNNFIPCKYTIIRRSTFQCVQPMCSAPDCWVKRTIAWIRIEISLKTAQRCTSPCVRYFHLEVMGGVQGNSVLKEALGPKLWHPFTHSFIKEEKEKKFKKENLPRASVILRAVWNHLHVTTKLVMMFIIIMVMIMMIIVIMVIIMIMITRV